MTADIDTPWARAQQRDSNRRAEANIRKVIDLFEKADDLLDTLLDLLDTLLDAARTGAIEFPFRVGDRPVTLAEMKKAAKAAEVALVALICARPCCSVAAR
jgi:hypothetical protein